MYSIGITADFLFILWKNENYKIRYHYKHNWKVKIEFLFHVMVLQLAEN